MHILKKIKTWINKHHRIISLLLIILIVIFIILLLCLPVLINYCYKWETDCKFLQSPSPWATYWATYLAAIASFAMVFVTWLTLNQNKDQLDELKKQWEEEHKPNVLIYLVRGHLSDSVDIEILNIGKSPAKNILFNIDCSIFDDIPLDMVKENLMKIGNSRPSFLLPNESLTFSLYKKDYERCGDKFQEKYYIAGVNVEKEEFNRFVNAIPSAEIKVNGSYDKKYKMHESISITNIRDPYSNINKSLYAINDTLRSINFNLFTKEIEIKD